MIMILVPKYQRERCRPGSYNLHKQNIMATSADIFSEIYGPIGHIPDDFAVFCSWAPNREYSREEIQL
jgi:hypothetical protein